MKQIIVVALLVCLVTVVASQNPAVGLAPAAGPDVAFLDSENVEYHHDSNDAEGNAREKRQYFGGGYGGGRRGFGGGYGGRGFGGGGYGGRGGFGGGGFGGGGFGGGGYGR